MKQRRRIYYSAEQKNLMWDRWQAGDSLHEIARLFDRGHSSIQGVLSETGGIRPRSRGRSRLALTLAEREEISRGVVAGYSLRAIAVSLAGVARDNLPKPLHSGPRGLEERAVAALAAYAGDAART